MLKTLVLAATAATLISAPALAQSYRIPTSNLHTPQGVALFEAKLKNATRSLCHGRQGADRASCRAAVRQEALDQLPRAQLLAYNQTRSGQQNAQQLASLANAG